MRRVLKRAAGLAMQAAAGEGGAEVAARAAANQGHMMAVRAASSVTSGYDRNSESGLPFALIPGRTDSYINEFAFALSQGDQRAVKRVIETTAISPFCRLHMPGGLNGGTKQLDEILLITPKLIRDVYLALITSPYRKSFDEVFVLAEFLFKEERLTLEEKKGIMAHFLSAVTPYFPYESISTRIYERMKDFIIEKYGKNAFNEIRASAKAYHDAEVIWHYYNDSCLRRDSEDVLTIVPEAVRESYRFLNRDDFCRVLMFYAERALRSDFTPSVFEMFLGMGANPLYLNHQGVRIFSSILGNGRISDEECQRRLQYLKSLGMVDQDLLDEAAVYAAERGDFENVETLVDAGAHPNRYSILPHSIDGKVTTVITALRRSSYERSEQAEQYVLSRFSFGDGELGEPEGRNIRHSEEAIKAACAKEERVQVQQQEGRGL